MELPKGTKLKNGEYIIQKKLGQGGFGITYLASVRIEKKGNLKSMTVEADVVIKEFFLKEYCLREEDNSVIVTSRDNEKLVERYREKFEQEAKKLSKMNHPNIVEVNDVIVNENKTVYYVMRYLEGGTLYKWVRPDEKTITPLAEEKAIRYIKQIASALNYMHQRKMCHYDVKPSNIMLDKNDNAVLIDFGLAKNYTIDGEQTSTLLGGATIGYAPLEQANANLETFSPQTDVYALGATLYFLLTGHSPKAAAFNFDEVLPEGQCGISDKFWVAIKMCMQANPTDRPQSIEYFLQLIDKGEIVGDNGETEPLPPSDNGFLIRALYSKYSRFSRLSRIKYLFLILIAMFLVIILFEGKYFVDKRKGLNNYIVAIKYLEAKDTISAIPYLKKAVEYENPAAMTELGICYFNGKGVNADTIKAVQYFGKAASQDDAKAQVMLGECFEYGKGVPKDSIKAFQYFSLSAEQAYKDGMAKLAWCYDNGIGVAKDSIAAFQWYKKSAEAGSDMGIHNLGHFYLDGKVVKADTIEAVKLFKKAAEMGYSYSLYMMGWCYNVGCGVTEDPEESFNWFLKAAKQGDVDAMNRVGYVYSKGYGVVKDVHQAFRWYLESAKSNDSEGMFHLGLCYKDGLGVSKDSIKAMQWILKSALSGYKEAQEKMGDIYYDNKQYEKAVLWYTKAAKQKSRNSEYRLGFCYFFGDGVKADTAKAVKLWESSMQADTIKYHDGRYLLVRITNPGAMYNLSLCYENGWGVKKDAKKAKYWLRRSQGLEAENTQ